MGWLYRNSCDALIIGPVQGDGDTFVRRAGKDFDLRIRARCPLVEEGNFHGAIKTGRIGIGLRHKLGDHAKVLVRTCTIPGCDQCLYMSGIAFAKPVTRPTRGDMILL